MTKVQLLEKHIDTLKTYLKARFDVSDWNGVCDAANDIRVVEAELNAAKAYRRSLSAPSSSSEKASLRLYRATKNHNRCTDTAGTRGSGDR